jgi:hypothetical protein
VWIPGAEKARATNSAGNTFGSDEVGTTDHATSSSIRNKTVNGSPSSSEIENGSANGWSASIVIGPVSDVSRVIDGRVFTAISADATSGE